jgi:hypothetical protein
MATKRLRKLVEDALDTPGAVRRIMKGPITLNKHSLNIKFNRILTPKEKARLTRKLKKHMQSGNTRIKVRFIGKIKVGIDRNGDKRKVLNPLTGKRLIRGGQRYKLLIGKKGYREVRGILIPPEISNNKRNVRMFVNQFTQNNNNNRGTETVVTPVNTRPTAPVNARPTTPVNARPAAPVNTRPTTIPMTLYDNSGKVVNKKGPGVVPVVYVSKSGKPVVYGTRGATPVVYTNGKGGFVTPTTPGAVQINLASAPSLTAIANKVKKTLVKDNRSIFKKITNAFRGEVPLDPRYGKMLKINRSIANLTVKFNNVRKS